jgi:prophage antirepressor-like protein
VDANGETLFVAKDVATVLGYENTAQAVRIHCKHAKPLSDLGVLSDSTLDPQTRLIPESDLYRLTLKSTLDSAERFQDWVVEEVLPSIRKTGSYSAKAQPKPKRERIPSQLSAKMLIARQVRTALRLSDTSYIGMVSKIAESEGIAPAFLPAYVNETLTKALTPMLEGMGHPLATKVRSVVHPALEAMGIIEHLSRQSSSGSGKIKQFWSLTDEGLKYGRNETNPNNPRETQPLYFVDRFQSLLERIEAQVDAQQKPGRLALVTPVQQTGTPA